MLPGDTASGGDAEAVAVDGEAADLAERERQLIAAVVSLARFLRDERDRLAERLREIELQLASLAQQLEPPAGPSRQREA
jgi:hypothetical protein